MLEDLSIYTLDSNATIREAMAAIDAGATGVAMILGDKSRLEGLMTDGDLRRMLLAGAEMHSPITSAINRKFTSVSPSTPRADVLDLMHARTIEQIPVVDDDGRLVGVHSLGRIVMKDTLPNWAVIMAGGKGTRLGELTENIPKPMLKVAGRPILERIILHLVGSGVRRIFIAVNYLSHVIEEHFGDGSDFGCAIEYIREESPLGSGGALSLLTEKPEHPLIVMNGDLVTDFHVRRMLQHHEKGGYIATVGLNYYSHRVPFGCVTLEGGSVSEIREKPLLIERVNCGIYAISPDLLTRIKPEFFPITELFDQCLKNNEPVGGYVIEEDWVDIGLPEELINAQGKS
ncbi:MAG: nucleotidyltransferase family protein [Akkermansiaceae bacterium]|nr:nucleotidyltransferase family protein [Akkermansiaceae bacterium]